MKNSRKAGVHRPHQRDRQVARLEALEGEKKRRQVFSFFEFFFFFSLLALLSLDKKKNAHFTSSFPPPPLFSLPLFFQQQVTHTADYFGKLHDIAVDLIKKDKAYVCHQTQEQVKAARERREGSPFRDRPVQESLDLFAEMTRGNIAEGAATLRLKIDPKNNNLNMFDPVRSCVFLFSFFLLFLSFKGSLFFVFSFPQSKIKKHSRSPTASSSPSTLAPANSGASTLPTTLPTASSTRSRTSPTRSAPSSLRRAARATTGCWSRPTSTNPWCGSTPGCPSRTT